MNPLTVTDMHTGGEPLRIVTGGYPALPRGTILEKRAYVRDHLDHLRKILMFEPRGHYDMYGALLVEPVLPGADMAVLFMHNEGYSTMCGHAIIALGRFAVDKGLVARNEPVTRIGIECPCGLVVADVEVANGKAGKVSFESVPAFLSASEQTLTLPGYGAITFDLAYGGAYYALADCRQFGLEFGRATVRHFTDAADALTQAVKQSVSLSHPGAADLAFLYGTILTDGGEGRDAPSKNVCVFADRQVDRSPTGSGVTARMAAFAAKGTVAPGEVRTFESVTGASFTASIASHTSTGGHAAVTVRVSGRAHYSGEASFVVEPDDPLSGGFVVR